MSDDGDDGEKGLLKAHTPRGPAPAAPELPTADQIGAAVAALGAAIDADEGDQLDLLSGSPDLEPVDTLGAIAETSNAQRRARGRPKGSANKRNTAVFEYLEAVGHRDPAVTLSLYNSTDVKELARALGIKPAEAAQLQIRAADALMPYKYAKKPQALEVNKRELHVFLAGSLGTQQQAGGGGIFGNGQVEEYQALSGSATVRPQDGESHEDAETLDTQGVDEGRATD